MYFKSYNELFEYISDDASAYEFAKESRLIKLQRNCKCGAELRLETDSHQEHGLRFRCSRSRIECKKLY